MITELQATTLTRLSVPRSKCLDFIHDMGIKINSQLLKNADNRTMDFTTGFIYWIIYYETYANQIAQRLIVSKSISLIVSISRYPENHPDRRSKSSKTL